MIERHKARGPTMGDDTCTALRLDRDDIRHLGQQPVGGANRAANAIFLGDAQDQRSVAARLRNSVERLGYRSCSQWRNSLLADPVARQRDWRTDQPVTATGP